MGVCEGRNLFILFMKEKEDFITNILSKARGSTKIVDKCKREEEKDYASTLASVPSCATIVGQVGEKDIGWMHIYQSNFDSRCQICA